MKKQFILLSVLTILAACDKPAVPVDLSNQAKVGGVNIDGEHISVYRQDGNKWAAYGGENGDPERYILYRKERAIELKSGCRIDKRLSDKKDRILVATVTCGSTPSPEKTKTPARKTR